jgi:hypothetical protein
LIRASGVTGQDQASLRASPASSRQNPVADLPARFGVSGAMSAEMSPSLDIIEQET